MTPRPPKPALSPEEAELRRQRIHLVLGNAMRKRISLPIPPTPQPLGAAGEPTFPPKDEP